MNKQITEYYCSFEIAKILKEKGFDEPCFALYNPEGELIPCGIRLSNTQVERVPGSYSTPTHQMAMKWLREVHNISIVIEPHMYDYINEKNSSYVTSLWQGDNYYENIISKDYPAYEEAVEATLKYALENLI